MFTLGTLARFASRACVAALASLGGACDGSETAAAPAALSPPAEPAVQALSPRNVQISWGAAALGEAERLVVERQQQDAATDELEPLEGVAAILDVGLQPEHDYEYRLCRTAGAAARACSAWVSITTPTSELGTGTRITVPYEGDDGADDVLLFSLIDFSNQMSFGAFVLVDRTGRVLWEYVDTSRGYVNDVQMLDDGTILFNQYAELRVLDLFYRPLQRFVNAEHPAGTASPLFDAVTVFTEQFYHHGANPFGPDAFLSIVFTQRHDDVNNRDVLGDGVVVFDRETGRDSWFIDLFDYYDFHTDQCPICIQDVLFGIAADWSHSNALWFDAEQSLVYLNVRNLDRILVVDYPSGDLVREIGDGGVTFAHSHDPEFLPDGSILVFDNGLHRPGGETYSRAVQFRETGGGELEVVWEYREDPDFFSPVQGDADRLASGNTLITDGFNGRLLEVDPVGVKRWELLLDPAGLWIYKTQRIAGDRFRQLRGLR